MLLNMASAMGRLVAPQLSKLPFMTFDFMIQVLAGRELTRLAGFSQRVSLLLDVLEQLQQGAYSRTMVPHPALLSCCHNLVLM